MCERFTEQTCEAMRLANDEALWHQHGYVGSEHILCGLRRQETGLAARVLHTAGVSAETLRCEIAKLVKRGSGPISGKCPLTPRGLKVIELALMHTRQRHGRAIETDDVLHGILQEHDGVAAAVLMNAGVSREQLLRALFDPKPE